MNQFDPLNDIPLAGDSTQTQNGDAPRILKQRRIARGPVTKRKNFVLDTNVLLHDPTCIGRFEENHVWIPVDVLAELDKFKNEQSDRGANARAVHRSLSRIFGKNGRAVTQGIATDGGGTLRLAVFDLDG